METTKTMKSWVRKLQSCLSTAGQRKTGNWRFCVVSVVQRTKLTDQLNYGQLFFGCAGNLHPVFLFEKQLCKPSCFFLFFLVALQLWMSSSVVLFVTSVDIWTNKSPYKLKSPHTILQVHIWTHKSILLDLMWPNVRNSYTDPYLCSFKILFMCLLQST